MPDFLYQWYALVLGYMHTHPAVFWTLVVLAVVSSALSSLKEQRNQ